MRILFLSQVLPYPADAGPKIRSYYVLRYLTRQHRVSLVSFTRDADTPEAIEHLRSFCEQVLTVPMRRSKVGDLRAFVISIFKQTPLVIQRDDVTEMKELVDGLLASGDYDAIHSDQLWMAQYVPEIIVQDEHKNLLKILDEHNACFQIVQRLASRERNLLKRLVLERDWRLLQRYEKQTIQKFDKVVTVSKGDRATLTKLLEIPANEQSKFPIFSTIPICVDTDQAKPIQVAPDSMNVLHLGTMFWPPNVEGILWFIDQVWPKVQAQLSQAAFVIAGKNPPRQIKERAQDPRLRIQVTGYVPNPQAILEQAGVFIVPLFSGSGMRVKILDAWRWGLPVVSTQVGAEGIACEPGKNIMIADTAQEFAEAVIEIITQPHLSARLRRAGRAWVEEHYDWKHMYSAWDKIYSKIGEVDP